MIANWFRVASGTERARAARPWHFTLDLLEKPSLCGRVQTNQGGQFNMGFGRFDSFPATHNCCSACRRKFAALFAPAAGTP